MIGSTRDLHLRKYLMHYPEGVDDVSVVAGIDPGKGGGISFIDRHTEELLGTYRMPVDKDGILEMDIRTLLVEHCTQSVIIEKVWSMPGQGVSSTFTFGMGFGILKGICVGLQIPYYLIPPPTWRKTVGLTVGKSKDSSIAHAKNLFPYLSGDLNKDGPAESALICLAGIRKFLRGE